MVNSCSALNCKTRWKPDENIQFHKFPLGDKILLKKWIHQVGRKDWRPTKSSVLCSKHFSANSYKSSPDLKGRKLLRWAVPTIFDFTPKKTKKHQGKYSEGRHFGEGQYEESSNLDQTSESYLHKFKILQTVVEIKLGPDFSQHLSKSEEKERFSSETRTIEEAPGEKRISENSFSCERTNGPGTQQCEVQQTMLEMLDENEKLRKKVKTLQQKIRRRDRMIARIKKQAGLADG